MTPILQGTSALSVVSNGVYLPVYIGPNGATTSVAQGAKGVAIPSNLTCAAPRVRTLNVNGSQKWWTCVVPPSVKASLGY